MRQAVNAWIRTSGEYDAVIDFEAAVCDPADPSRILPAFDSGDHLHPNDASYQAMANAIDLRLLKTDGEGFGGRHHHTRRSLGLVPATQVCSISCSPRTGGMGK